MIKINIQQQDYRFEISMNGHAGAERVNGIDEVCAGASMIMCMLAQHLSISHTYKRGEIHAMQLGKGSGHLVYVSEPRWYPETLDNFLMCKHGFELMQDKYPECISVTTNVCG